MIPAALRVLATRHELLTQHLGAYAVLASAEAGEWAGGLRRRAVFGALAATLALLFVLLGGVALLLVASIPTEQMPAPWVLAVLPAALIIATALCGWLASRPIPPAFEALRTQLGLDIAMWHAADEARHEAADPTHRAHGAEADAAKPASPGPGVPMAESPAAATTPGR